MAEKSGLSGGALLRKIRERQGIEQLELNSSGVMTQANYSKIENDKSTPTRLKLEAILDLFEATFNERRGVMKAYGYLPPYPIPSEAEIQAICARCQPILDAAEMPACLLDFLTRLLTWNTPFVKLQGDLEPDGVLYDLRYKPLFKAQFDSRVAMTAYMDDLEPYLLAEMQAIREWLSPHRNEHWYSKFIDDLRKDKDFNAYWQITEDTDPPEEQRTEMADQIVQSVNFSLPGSGASLEFHANLDAVLDDDRFQIVYLIPADPLTLRQVEGWNAEMSREEGLDA